MRRLGRTCLVLAILSPMFVEESQACWWRRHCRCHQRQVAACTVPYQSYGAPVSAAPLGYGPWATPQATGAREGTAPAGVVAEGAAVGPPKTFVFKGKTYVAIDTNERGESEEAELRVPPEAQLAPRRPSDGEHFAGVARRDAKTSFVGGAPLAFNSPGAALDFILQGNDPRTNDGMMRSKLSARSPRAPEEMRNVTVMGFLYATKKEADNDFHLLIGDNPNGGDGRFMTAEVSGLPVATNAQTPQFLHVRDEFKEFFRTTGQQLPGSRYRIFPDPVPVTITGSVFFDVDHEIGQVHSRNAAPGTVWEIHPVTDIVFGPSGGP
jgi:hypothetical protein